MRCHRKRRSRAITGQHGEYGTDDRTRGEPALLARALIVDEQVTAFRVVSQGTTEASAEEILFHGGARLALLRLKIFVGVEDVIAEKLESRTMPLRRATLQDGIDVATAVAALSRVIETGLHLEFLHRIGAGQGRVEQLRVSEIGDTDSFEKIVVVVLPLAVYVDADIAAAELRGGVQIGTGASAESVSS